MQEREETRCASEASRTWTFCWVAGGKAGKSLAMGRAKAGWSAVMVERDPPHHGEGLNLPFDALDDIPHRSAAERSARVSSGSEHR